MKKHKFVKNYLILKGGKSVYSLIRQCFQQFHLSKCDNIINKLRQIIKIHIRNLGKKATSVPMPDIRLPEAKTRKKQISANLQNPISF